MTTFEEKVMNIIENSDFNSLPLEEREKIIKYNREQQITTLWQILNGNKSNTTETYRKWVRKWLADCVESYRKDYVFKE